MTVVFDDEELYRRLKVRAAETGVSMKDLIERSLRRELEGSARESDGNAFDWERYEQQMDAWREEDADLGIEADEIPTDLSDIKRHLYGWPKGTERRHLSVAEEREPYSAK